MALPVPLAVTRIISKRLANAWIMSARYYREPEPCLACVQRHRSGISPTILFSGFLFPLNDGTARQTSVSLVRIKPIVKAPSMPQSQILWVVSSKTPLFATLHLENVALPLPAIVVYPVPVQPPVRVSPHLRSVTVRVSVWYVSIPAVPRRTVFSLVFFSCCSSPSTPLVCCSLLS